MTRFNVKSRPHLVTLIYCLVLILVTPTHVMGLPPSVSALEHQASTAYNNGDYSAALYYLHQILKVKPTAQILTNTGSTLNE